MADLERYDQAMLGVAQQVSAAAAPAENPIDTLLDVYFGFLRRKTDFFRRAVRARVARCRRARGWRAAERAERGSGSALGCVRGGMCVRVAARALGGWARACEWRTARRADAARRGRDARLRLQPARAEACAGVFCGAR
jgi:hypothetical protein